MLKKIYSTLSEPRFITGATITAYLIVILLAVDVTIYVLPLMHPVYWVPAIFMFAGAMVGLPSSWIGGQSMARLELISLPITIGGLLGGVTLEAHEIWGTDFAGHVMVALVLMVLIAVIVRWKWLRTYYTL